MKKKNKKKNKNKIDISKVLKKISREKLQAKPTSVIPSKKRYTRKKKHSKDDTDTSE
ncbi:MAG: hypothetical protein OEZ22_09865 [Spirochaetia bacterium]|nr:hypothetical protein [Spirochaetia bacterium]